MGGRRGVCRVLMGKLRRRDHLEDPHTDVRIILRWSFKKWDDGVWTGLIWLSVGTGDGNLWMQ
jgi:hypothetical protein